MNSSESPSFDREYQALRAGQAVVELTGWSSISVTGADRQTFLNNFCTNDVKRLAPSASCEAFFCNVKGKIVGHGVISCRESELVIVGVPRLASQLFEHLDRYIIREDVQLSDNTAARTYVYAAGDAKAPTVPTVTIPWDLIDSGHGRIIEVASREAESLGRILGGQKLLLAGRKAFTAARIEAGLPLFRRDFNEENFPQEIGRDKEAISFTKGCYLGQETVARIDAIGHVNQKIARIRFFGEAVPEKGVELTLNDKPVGHVTSAAFSPKFGAPLGLAMIRREANAPETRLESSAGACEIVS